MKIGFIGCGNMAAAIIKGITENNFIAGKDINVFDINNASLETANEAYGITICTDEIDVVLRSEIVILAVKPNIIKAVLEKIDSTLEKSSPLLISIAAGKTLDYIAGCTDTKCRTIRIMPNINAKVGEAICAYCGNELATDSDKDVVNKMLSCIGKSLEIEEKSFPLFGVLGGCAPAFSYMFIDALARAGVHNGMKKDEALKIAAQTVYGSAKMILESDEHPWKLIDNVCSPGGTTIEGILSLQSDGFENAVHNAVNKALDKDKKL